MIQIDLSKIPYDMGDKIIDKGIEYKILGIHLYIGDGGGIKSVRYYVGNNKFITKRLKG